MITVNECNNFAVFGQYELVAATHTYILHDFLVYPPVPPPYPTPYTFSLRLAKLFDKMLLFADDAFSNIVSKLRWNNKGEGN